MSFINYHDYHDSVMVIIDISVESYRITLVRKEVKDLGQGCEWGHG